MPSLLKMTLALGLRLYHGDDLGMGLNQLFLGQHTSSARKLLKYRIDQHQVIEGSGGAPTMADAAHLAAPDGVTLPETVAMARSLHTRPRVVLDTVLGTEHPAAQGTEAVVLALIEQEKDLEEYYPHDPILKPNL